MHEDRFTELPKEVAHNIIFLLRTPDFFALYRSSKKCQELCLTTPLLTFDFLSFFVGEKGGEEYANKLVNYLERFLAHRGERKTQYFHLLCFDSYRPLTLLHYAIRNGVEVLDLEFIVKGDKKPCIFLPLSLYRSGSLRSLTLDFINEPMVYWDFPSSIPFPNLQFLTSKSMRVNDRSSFGEWISSWHNIKEIRLERVDIDGIVSIKSSCLERFEIVSSDICNLSISGERLEEVVVDRPRKLFKLSISGERVKCIMVIWKSVTSKNTTMEISAPNLKELNLSGFRPDSIVLEKFMHLERVSMYLGPSMDKRCISSILLDVVSSTPQISLCGFTAKDLYEHDSPNPTLDVEILLLHIHLHNDLYPPAVVHLLKRMHNLTALYIRAVKTLSTSNLLSSKRHGFDMNYWEHQDDLKIIHQLKHAEIDILSGEKELELAKYLAKHAKQMEEMIIRLRYPLSSEANEDVTKLKKTSNARIVVYDYTKM